LGSQCRVIRNVGLSNDQSQIESGIPMKSRFSFALLLLQIVGAVALAQESRRPGGANSSFATREFRATNGQTLKFSLFVPADRGAEKLPLVLCLHGSGGNTAAANILAASDVQKKHPCVILAPACDSKKEGWVDGPSRRGIERRSVAQELLEILDSIVKEANVDSTRVYVTGQSMGGVGTWGLLANHANRFAAAVPVCGIWKPDDAAKMNGVAIWAFHGDQDQTVPVSGSREMIAALKKAGVTPEPRYTEFAGVGHGSWTPAYATPELWDWMFAQQRTTTAGPR
jgi:predicted peptidase